MASNNKVAVGCRITEERKQDWDDFIGDSDEFNTQAQLIRTAVERFISDSQSDTEEQLEMVRDDLQGILREIKQTRIDIDDLEDNIDDAEDISNELMFELERFFDNQNNSDEH